MNKFEQFLSAHKAIFVILTIIILPFVLVFCLIYGVIVGLIGITVDRYETVRRYIYRDAIELLKYRKWKEDFYKETYLETISDRQQRMLAEKDFQEGRKKAPGMIGNIISDIIVVGIMEYPFLLVWGIITGPVRALIEIWKWWMKVWGKEVWGVNYF